VTPLQNWLGGTEYLLLAAAVSALFMLGMLLTTNARYYRVLIQADDGGGAQIETPPLRKLLSKRFVILIFAYQMLSAVVSQLLDFMIVAAAGERFTESATLASFFGNYTIVVNLLDLLFLALLAGILLSRFGLKFGLAANPGVDILILIATLIIGLAAGPTTILFFWLVAAARIVDIVFTDGTTRTSINATFQALPPNERVTVQTGVEGIGVPVALGLTGVALLVFNALGDVTLVHVALFTLVIAFLWTGAALFVYWDYAENLLKSMRRRVLNPVELNLEDKANFEATQRLLRSEKISDVRLALDMLQGAEHPSLPEELISLLQSDSGLIQIEALARVEPLRIQPALPLVEDLSASASSGQVQGAAIRTLCALEEAEAVERVAPYLDSSQQDVRLGAAVGLLRYGSIPGVLAVGRELESWEQSSDAADRCFLARVIEEVALEHVYHPLMSMLVDPDLDVRRAALRAAGKVKHASLLPLIVQNLADGRTRSTASDTLVSYGDDVLPTIEQALSGGLVSEADTVRLVRVCGQIKGERVQILMRRNLDHSSNLVRDQIMAVLSASGFQGETADLPALNKALVRDVNYGHQVIIAWQDIGESEPTEPLRQALLEERAQAIRRVFLILSFIYEARPVMRAQAQLAHGTGSEQALALEMLDVTLSAEHNALAFPLIDPKLDTAQRIQLLNKRFDNQSMYRDKRLQDLIENGDPAWTRACALYGAAKLGAVGQVAAEDLVPIIEKALADPDPIVRETAEWSLHKLAPRRFGEHVEVLLADADPCVARVAADLIGA
jgi:HEAT repeat protein